MAAEYQEHGAAGDPMDSPKVLYAYANGSANTIRPMGAVYPDGTFLLHVYPAGASDKLSRVSQLEFDEVAVAKYTCVGLSTPVKVFYPAAGNGVFYTLITGEGSNPYAGLDRFGRVSYLQWLHNVTSSGSGSGSGGRGHRHASLRSFTRGIAR